MRESRVSFSPLAFIQRVVWTLSSVFPIAFLHSICVAAAPIFTLSVFDIAFRAPIDFLYELTRCRTRQANFDHPRELEIDLPSAVAMPTEAASSGFTDLNFH